MKKIESTLQSTLSHEVAPGAPLKVSDLDFYTLLRRQADESRLFFNQRRAVIFDVEAIGALRQQLIESLGVELATGVLTRFGYAQGYSDANMLAENFEWETEGDWLAAGPSLHMLEGIVHVEPQKIEFNRETGHFHMQGVWLNSYEAEEHLRRFGVNDQPVCWTLTGYASGYTTRFFGQELLAIETECVGKGDSRCCWEIRPLAAWGSEAEPHRQALKKIDISNQLVETNRQLQEQIAERKQIEETLQTSQRFLQDILDSMPSPVYVIDVQGKFRLINEVFANLFSLDKKDVIGKTDFDIFANDTAEEFQSNDLEILRTGMPVEVEEQIKLADGEYTYLTHKYPLRDANGVPYALAGISTNITERKKAEEMLAKRAAEMETITQVSTAAATILETDKLLQEVVNLTKSSFGLYHAHIYLLNRAENRLDLTAGAGEVGRQMVAKGWSISLDRENSLVVQAARTRQAVIANNVRQTSDFLPNPLLPETQSEMAVPLIAGDKVLGVLDVQADVINRFTEEDKRIETILAGQIAVALENARLFEQTQAQARREQILREVTARVRSSVDADTIMRTAVQEVGRALGRTAFVYLGDGDKQSNSES